MKMLALLVLFVLLFVATFANGQCGSNCLFYGGDFDPNNPNANGLANENDAPIGGNPYGAATYQNFINSESWNVSGLFTNNLSGLTPRNGYWEIRTGISEGNGGTLIASGTGAVTNSPTGRYGWGMPEYRNEVDGLNVSLSPGMYWEGVVPVCVNCDSRSFNSNTFGLNGVGTQIRYDQFFNSWLFEANFTNAEKEEVFVAFPNYDLPASLATFPSFSSGVIGTTVPEPSSILMLATGFLGVAGVVRRRCST